MKSGSRSLSVEQNLEGPKSLEDLDSDMWGMTVMIITKDLANIMLMLRLRAAPGRFESFRFLYGSTCQALNIGLQLLLLVYVNKFVVKPAVHNVQEDYVAYHAEVFDPDGTFRHDLWHLWTGPCVDLCNSAMTKLTFTSAITFLWTTRMLGEFRSAWRLWRHVMRVPSMPGGAVSSDMVSIVSVDGVDMSHIIFLSCGTRLMLLLFCAIPKAIVAIALWFIGCRWLNATQSFNDLILNALALEFIINIDETILSNFFPDGIHKDIEAVKFAFPNEEDSEDKHDAQAVRAYLRSFVLAVLAFGWCYMYLNFWQQVLPEFKHDISRHCQGDWFTGKYNLLCYPFNYTCFPYGPADGEPLPKVPLDAGSSTGRLLQAPSGGGVTAASLLAEIALLPSVA